MRRYLICDPVPGQKDRVIREVAEDSNKAAVALSRELPGEAFMDIAEALRRAYENGRDDMRKDLFEGMSEEVLVAGAAIDTLMRWGFQGKPMPPWFTEMHRQGNGCMIVEACIAERNIRRFELNASCKEVT